MLCMVNVEEGKRVLVMISEPKEVSDPNTADPIVVVLNLLRHPRTVGFPEDINVIRFECGARSLPDPKAWAVSFLEALKHGLEFRKAHGSPIARQNAETVLALLPKLQIELHQGLAPAVHQC